MTVPSDQNERTTAKPVHIPTVLAVGCSDALLSRCWDCLSGMSLMVRDCEPPRAATLAAARRPLVIVVASQVYALDADELEALARDVQATLVPLAEDADETELRATLTAAVREARRRPERRTSSGRYSILPGELYAAPLARTEPPPTSAPRPLRRALPDPGADLADLDAVLPAARR
jgi:hypothetical protein